MKYLFHEWNTVKETILRAKEILLFLDDDGVLVPIAPRPEMAVCPASIRSMLATFRDLPAIFPVVMSGRSLEDVRAMVGVQGIIYVGNHGLEIQNPAGTHKKILSASRKREFEQIRQALQERLGRIPGVILEDKGAIMAVHYRNAPSARFAEIEQILAATLATWENRWQVTAGKKVFEIRPKALFSKGKAVQDILKGMPSKGVLPMYFGDDETDEDAFRFLRQRGVTVFVGSELPESAAEYYVKDPAEVEAALRRIVELRKGEGFDAGGRGSEPGLSASRWG